MRIPNLFDSFHGILQRKKSVKIQKISRYFALCYSLLWKAVPLDVENGKRQNAKACDFWLFRFVASLYTSFRFITVVLQLSLTH